MEPTAAVIDLGTDRGVPASDVDGVRMSPRYRMRHLALSAAVLLVAALGGAAPPGPPSIAEIVAVPLGMNSSHLLTSDRLFVAGPALGASHAAMTVSAYALPSGRPLWTTRIDRPADRPRLAVASDLLLVTADAGEGRSYATMALETATGRERWTLPHLIDQVSTEDTAPVIEEVFPPESEIPAGKATNLMYLDSPVRVYLDSSGRGHRLPPIGVTASAIDLPSGRVTWRSPVLVAARIVAAADGRPGTILTVTGTGEVEVRDARTGAVLRRITGNGEPYLTVTPAGKLILASTRSTLAAYPLGGGQHAWTRPVPAPDSYLASCGPVICQHGPGNFELLDPTTGATRWRLPVGVVQFDAGHLVQYDHGLRPARTLDPATGRTLIDLTGWEGWSGLPDQPAVLLTRSIADRSRTVVGLLDQDATSVRILTEVPYPVDACQVGRVFFSCQTGLYELRVWRYGR